MNNRRELLVALGAGALTAPLTSFAQQQGMPVIGFLNGASYDGASYDLSEHLVRAFRQALSEIGYVEGRNVAIEYRSADGQYDRRPALAVDPVRRNVSVIAAAGTPTGLPAKAATATIPIVFASGSDPVELPDEARTTRNHCRRQRPDPPVRRLPPGGCALERGARLNGTPPGSFYLTQFKRNSAIPQFRNPACPAWIKRNPPNPVCPA